MRNLFTLVLAIVCFDATAQSPDAFYTAVKSGNWEQSTQLIETHFEQYGLYGQEDLGWSKAPINQLFNTYDNRYYKIPVITVSDFPNKKNIWSYWDFWSNQVTNGQWDYRNFFKNKKEAVLLAKYNVLILLAHEYGHHIGDRFDVESKNLNCKEYQADKLSYVLQTDLNSNSKFARLYGRYRELITTINKLVNADSRFDNPSFSKLEQNCEEISVVYPTDSSLMVQYASAFFARRLALYESQITGEKLAVEFYLKADVEWKNKYPMKPLRCLSQTHINNRLTLGSDYQSKQGIKRLSGWGLIDDLLEETSTQAFDSNGNLFFVQANINKKVSPGDLWDFRFYDSAGNYTAIWYTTPPFLQQISYISIHSVYINDVDNSLVILVNLKETWEDNNLYLLYPNKDGLSLNWVWIGVTDPNQVYPIHSINPASFASLTYVGREEPRYEILGDSSSNYSIRWIKLTDETAGLKMLEVAGTDHHHYIGTEGYLLHASSDIKTIVGSGVSGFRCNEAISEMPPISSMRIVGDRLFVAHRYRSRSNQRDSILIRSYSIRD